MKLFRFQILVMAMMAFVINVNAQDNQEAMIKYNLFKGDYKAKNYQAAFDNWLWCLDNSPKLSVNIYKLGVTIAKDNYKRAAEADKATALDLVKRVYDQRIQYFPKDLAKVYSDYASFLISVKADNNEVFDLLHKAYEVDPSKMGVKAMYIYFQAVVDKNKDNNVQLVFDTYDNMLKAVNKKMDLYTSKLDGYAAKEESGASLTKNEIKYKNAYEKNSIALGQIEGGLDAKIAGISTCDRLIPLYKANFEANKNNPKWLKSAVSRMYKKECTEDDLYDQLVEAYVAAEPSPQASVFYAGILLKKNEFDKAKTYYDQAISQETDAYKKAGYLYKIANIMKKKGRLAAARNYARKALTYKRSMGQAYLLIASLYAKSANNCGETEFEKRMVYVAAMNEVQKAISVDPTIKKTALKYLKSYKSSAPSKKLIFTEGVASGSSHQIGCWIGQTVKIP